MVENFYTLKEKLENLIKLRLELNLKFLDF